MTRAELLDLFTPIYDSFWMTGFNSLERKGPQIFDEIVDATKDYKFNRISGLGMWDAATEDSEDGLDHFVMGYEGTISPSKYRKYFYVTYEANDQMEYASLKRNISSQTPLGRGGAARLEALAAGILINGFSTACADGQFLFDTDHPKNPEETGTTYDNLLSGAFSHDNLEAAEKEISANFFDLDGLPMAPYAGKPIIVHPSALRGAVKRVLDARADERPGVTTRDINVYAGKYDAIEWSFLDAAMGGSDTAWFIIYPQLKSLKVVKNTEKPQFASWIDNLKQRYYFDGWLHADADAEDWRGVWGSTGL
jgi:hypothetical protein